jgi:hypothetical protein
MTSVENVMKVSGFKWDEQTSAAALAPAEGQTRDEVAKK